MDDAQTMLSKQDLPNQGSDAGTAVDPRWKRRVYMIMSFFVCWQTLAIIMPPLPQGSGLVQLLRSVLQPYITIFRLDNQWSFFAPGVGRGGEFRYVVEGSDGRRHVFQPTEKRESIPQFYMWREWKYFYDKVMQSADSRGYLIAGLYCKKHEELNPVSVSLLQVSELEFSPSDYLQGYRHNHSKFIQVESLGNYEC